MMDLSRTLIESYGGQAPRYTSYPPANHFHAEEKLIPSLKQYFQDPNHQAQAYSLYLHFPYCSELCYFCGCNMEITHSKDKVQNYLDLLHQEVDLWAQLSPQPLPVAEIHFGGGSPSDISIKDMQAIMDQLRQRFAVRSDARISIEVDPRNMESEKRAKDLIALGFNRISLGVQDFEPRVQAAVNRIQPVKKTFDTYRWFRKAGITSINVDLMYGLPLQTIASFQETLAKVIDLDPDRIALFQFAYLPKLKKHHKLIKPEELPPAEIRLQLFEMALNKLLACGYEYLGMDHFAKPSDPLAKAAKEKRMGRNFQGYHEGVSRHMIGFGVSSIGTLDHLFFQNTKDVAVYQEKLTQGQLSIERGLVMSKDDRIRQFVIEHLMCDFAVDYDAVRKAMGIRFADYFHTELLDLIPMQDDGLIYFTADGFGVSEQGKHFIRYIAKVFDAYARAGRMSEHHMKVV